MNTRLARLLLSVVIIGSTSIALAAPSSAQVSFGVSPSILQLTAAPGSTGEQTLEIVNNSDEATPVTLEIVAFPDLSPEFSAVDWITLGASEVDLVPEGQTPVNVAIAVPENAATGGAYAQILITSGNNPDSTDEVQIGGQLVVGVLFEIEGDGEVRREIEATQLAPTLEQDGRVGFRAEISNTGNTLAFLTGEMELTAAGDDEPTASLQVGLNRILPSITGAVSSEGSLPLPAGSEWTAATTIYPGDPAEIDNLKPVEIESEFSVDPHLEIGASICENLDRGPTISLELNNAGSIGLVPAVSLSLTTSTGNVIASIIPQDASVAWPGENTSTAIEGLPQLDGGDYTLTVSALIVQGLDPIVTEVPFSIGGFGDNVAPLCGSEPAATPGA